jgi:hypothetical protein
MIGHISTTFCFLYALFVSFSRVRTRLGGGAKSSMPNNDASDPSSVSRDVKPKTDVEEDRFFELTISIGRYVCVHVWKPKNASGE